MTIMKMKEEIAKECERANYEWNIKDSLAYRTRDGGVVIICEDMITEETIVFEWYGICMHNIKPFNAFGEAIRYAKTVVCK